MSRLSYERTTAPDPLATAAYQAEAARRRSHLAWIERWCGRTLAEDVVQKLFLHVYEHVLRGCTSAFVQAQFTKRALLCRALDALRARAARARREKVTTDGDVEREDRSSSQDDGLFSLGTVGDIDDAVLIQTITLQIAGEVERMLTEPKTWTLYEARDREIFAHLAEHPVVPIDYEALGRTLGIDRSGASRYAREFLEQVAQKIDRELGGTKGLVDLVFVDVFFELLATWR